MCGLKDVNVCCVVSSVWVVNRCRVGGAEGYRVTTVTHFAITQNSTLLFVSKRCGQKGCQSCVGRCDAHV